MSQSPTVSIVIPVYNAEKTIGRALESALAQTYSPADVAVIVVDDGSIDETKAIVKGYAQRDDRISILSHDMNKGRLEARRTGVLAAKGGRILFLDADDELDKDACSVCLSDENLEYDIVQFGFEIRYLHPVSDESRAFTDAYCQPPAEIAHDDEIPHIFFRDRKGPWSLDGKMFRAEVLKRAFSYIPKSEITQAEDACACFIASDLAKSYKGIPAYRGYVYNIDAGSSDAAWTAMNLEQFGYSCAYINAMNVIKSYIDAMGRWSTLGSDYHQAYAEHLYSVTGRLLHQVRDQDKARALDVFASQWPKHDVAGAIANVAWDDCADCLESFAESCSLHPAAHPIKTVALYYNRLGIGGAERVARELMLLWNSMGYKVLFFADEEPNQGDYPLPDDIRRIVLPAAAAVTRETYAKRASALQDALISHKVDLLVYFQWDSPLIGWDAFASKMVGTKVAVYTQSNFGSLFRRSLPWSLQLPFIYAQLDGIITLSDSDLDFWRSFNQNAWKSINPLTIMPRDDQRSSLSSKEIAWEGRLHHEEKQPVEAMEIMAEVVRLLPEAHLTIVGPPTEDCKAEDLTWKARQLGIEANVSVVGPSNDVRSYLKKASVFLMTSSFEGYCLALAEAKATGLPCVMYALPYLELTKGNRGIVPINTHDHAPYLQMMETEAGRAEITARRRAAAEAIVHILRDDSLRRKLADASYEHMLEFTSFDFRGLWQRVFEGLATKDLVTSSVTASSRLMMETLVRGSRYASSMLSHTRRKLADKTSSLERAESRLRELEPQLESTRSELAAKSKSLDVALKELTQAHAFIDELRSSTTWQVGSIATWLPRKAKDTWRNKKR